MFKCLQLRQFYSGACLPSDFSIILNKGNLSKHSHAQLHANKFMVMQSVYGVWSHEKEQEAINFVRLYNKQLRYLKIHNKCLHLDEDELVSFLQFKYNRKKHVPSDKYPFWY